MGTKYSSQSASGYNSSPPPDDGSTSASNKITWSKIKTALADVLKTYTDAINSQLVTALDFSITSQATTYTTVAGDHQKPIQVTGTTTVSLGDATTMGSGYQATIINTGTGLVTVALATATDALNGTTNGTLLLAPYQSVTCAVAGTGYDVISTANKLELDQNSQSAAYALVASDAGKHILHPTADNNARTFTIPANASVAFPIGTAITFVNQINTVTIAITSDTLTQAGTGSTGSRTLAANGIATALKVASTSWMINGTGLS